MRLVRIVIYSALLATQIVSGASGQESTASIESIRSAQQDWLSKFSSIRVQWRQWTADDLHRTDPSLPPNIDLKDSPRFTREEFCWNNLGQFTMSQWGVVGNVPRSFNMYRTNTAQPRDPETVPGWTSLEIMRAETARSVSYGPTKVAMTGLWDSMSGRWFPERLLQDKQWILTLLPQEEINGVMCDVVQKVTSDADARTRISTIMCFDPGHQFLPCKFVETTTTPDATWQVRWTVDEFQVVDGMAFPKRGYHFATGLTEPGIEWYIEAVEFNPVLPLDHFEPRMSPGTRIINYDQGDVELTADDGKNISGSNPDEPSGTTSMKNSTPDKDSHSAEQGLAVARRSIWGLFSVLCVITVFRTLFVKYKQKRSV